MFERLTVEFQNSIEISFEVCDDFLKVKQERESITDNLAVELGRLPVAILNDRVKAALGGK
jgi:hypothetical protein